MHLIVTILYWYHVVPQGGMPSLGMAAKEHDEDGGDTTNNDTNYFMTRPFRTEIRCQRTRRYCIQNVDAEQDRDGVA